MMDKLSSLSARLRFRAVLDFNLVLMLLGTWLGLLGRFHWTLDLFSHFRWQYVILCGVALLWSLMAKRSRLMIGFCVASLVMNVNDLYQARGKDSWTQEEGAKLRVVSLNVLTGNPQKQGVLDYLRSTRADVIFLMEVDAAWGEALESLKSNYPHHLLGSREDNFGVAFFSRVPLLSVEVWQPSPGSMPSIQARLMHDGQEMVILGIHPLPPIGPRLAARRDWQLQEIGQRVAFLKQPVLVVGDLNATPWSWGMKLIRQGNELDFRSPAPAWTPTWQVGTPVAVPIDHALCTPPLVIVGRKIGPDVGSDHRPQELEVGWLP
ncbi:endonuclease/exonuclease/phosphatase family protein [Prosthecobacter dejongeii]|uniref:Endonuclease/exonuclease/phosphatase (EEP) superfamily protein YafD n=1 Tax=Prosthecobacter dejongeii TaxID=48465 RepID=A0A7W7YQQ3_9BACT|nr:endonuclease/exonuclease/phosphatase family protein [Prosthecobacter dejongeii]MBB5040407.1 endonuclease/exonuclease/phosphatase (EEP) superfamily protein YafD [Prosthecobacter dejongeii]